MTADIQMPTKEDIRTAVSRARKMGWMTTSFTLRTENATGRSWVVPEMAEDRSVEPVTKYVIGGETYRLIMYAAREPSKKLAVASTTVVLTDTLRSKIVHWNEQEVVC